MILKIEITDKISGLKMSDMEYYERTLQYMHCDKKDMDRTAIFFIVLYFLVRHDVFTFKSTQLSVIYLQFTRTFLYIFLYLQAMLTAVPRPNQRFYNLYYTGSNASYLKPIAI